MSTTTTVTMKDVARMTNVLVATVSRALSGRVNVGDAVRKRVLEIAHSMDYSPDHAARSLISRRTRTVGVVLPDLPCEFFARLMCGIDAAARERGLQLLVSGHHADLQQQSTALRDMRGRVDGILVMSPHAGVDVLAANLPASLPVLLLDSDTPGPEVNNLRVDNYGGAKSMMHHLAESGYCRIAFVAGRERISTHANGCAAIAMRSQSCCRMHGPGSCPATSMSRPAIVPVATC